MKRRTSLQLCFALSLTGCGLFQTEHATLGADGVPVFVGKDFRHPANEPFFCFAHTTPKAERTSSCHEIQSWCADELTKVRADGLNVLDACVARDQVSCLTFYRGDAAKTACYATTADCEQAYAAFISPDYGARRDQLTACTQLDRSWHPPG